MAGGRKTPIEKWKLELPYFDGMCEVLLAEDVRTAHRRCRMPACHEVDGFAVCVRHAWRIKEEQNFFPGAGEFRFGHLVEHAPIAIPESMWEF